jgi:hypothetical protein
LSEVTPPSEGAPAEDPGSPAARKKGAGVRKPRAVRRAIGRLPASLTKVTPILAAISSLVASIVLLGQNVPKLPQIINSIRPPVQAHVKPNPLVVIVSRDDVLLNSYIELLQGENVRGQDVQIQTRDPSQVHDVLDLKPGLVIFGASSPTAEPPFLDSDVRQFLAGQVKVIGIGLFGTKVFEEIEPNSALSTRHATGMTSHVLRLAKGLSTDVLEGLPAEGSFPLYDQQADDPSVTEEVILNLGGLGRQGAKPIAELDEATDACVAKPWPVARQGNRVFWGSGLRADYLSSEAQELFFNLVHDLLLTDITPQGPQGLQEFPPGEYPGHTLGCRNTQNEYPLQISGPGVIDVKVRPTSPLPNGGHLVLTLAGPRPEDARMTKEESPHLNQQVTADQFRQSDSWLVLVSYDGSLTQGGAEAYYDLDIEYPSRTASPIQRQTILVGLALGALLSAFSAWLLWVRRTELRAHLDASSRRLRLLFAALRGG